jgi:molybdopterin converting factor small subunit
MKIKVYFFGILTDVTGTNEQELKDIENLSALKSWLWRTYPTSKELDFQVAVNRKLTEGKIDFKNGDEIALLPPFAGG